MVYDSMGNYPNARSCYERAVDIGHQSLPANHPDLRDYRKLLELVEKIL